MQKPRASTIGSSFSLENSQGGKECKEEEPNSRFVRNISSLAQANTPRSVDYPEKK